MNKKSVKLLAVLFIVINFLTLLCSNLNAANEPYHNNFSDSAATIAPPPKFDLPPDATGYDYNSYINTNNHQLLVNTYDSEHNDGLDYIIKFGKRNIEWLEYINQFRKNKLFFSSPKKLRAYPVDSPRSISKQGILNEYNTMLEQLSDGMRSVLLGESEFTKNPPIDTDKYLELGLDIDYIYQAVSRLRLLRPYIDYYRSAKSNDIRGYYHLTNIPDEERENILTRFNNLSDEEKNKISNWLVGMCFNQLESDSTCRGKLELSLILYNGDASYFYNEYLDNAKKIYNNFFTIEKPARRQDIVWQEFDNKIISYVPFNNNITDNVKNFLYNIEEEWKWDNWQLKLDFQTKENIPYIEFEPEATPHVDKLGGNQIVMDANKSLDEWDTKWTIRHEFGHILGFPDCYIEFYDENTEAFVSYQIDTSNLMCSRRGKLQEQHYNELKVNQ